MLVLLEGIYIDQHVPVPHGELTDGPDFRFDFPAKRRFQSRGNGLEFRFALGRVITDLYPLCCGEVKSWHGTKACAKLDVIADGSGYVKTYASGACCKAEVQMVEYVRVFGSNILLCLSRHNIHACNGCYRK